MAEILPVPDDVRNLLARLSQRLNKQRNLHNKLDRYIEGNSDLPAAIVRARVTRAYRMLMPIAEAPWADLIVSSTQDRLEVNALRDDDKKAAEVCWGLWQDNKMDLESKVAHNSILADGRAAAIVWREPGSDFPEVSLDNMGTTVVEFQEGSRRKRKAAMRYWHDDERGVPMATVYTDEFLYKVQAPKTSGGLGGVRWQRRIERKDNGEAEAWPLPNPYNVVPVVEIGVNRRLKPGCFPYARGEYEHCLGLIDRINLLTFLGLVVAFYMGFPLRGVVGDRILRDDNDKPIAPFDAHAGGIFQLENPVAKIAEYKAADRDNLSIYAELDQLATISKTPRHYFPMKSGMQNLAADALRASEGALHAKVSNYKPTLGEGWLDVCRLLGAMSDDQVELSPRAVLGWKDHESRSLAERADAASKLKDVLPGVAIAELALGIGQDDWNRWSAAQASDRIGQLVAAATQPTNGGTPAQPAGALPRPGAVPTP